MMAPIIICRQTPNLDEPPQFSPSRGRITALGVLMKVQTTHKVQIVMEKVQSGSVCLPGAECQ